MNDNILIDLLVDENEEEHMQLLQQQFFTNSTESRMRFYVRTSVTCCQYERYNVVSTRVVVREFDIVSTHFYPLLYPLVFSVSFLYKYPQRFFLKRYVSD